MIAHISEAFFRTWKAKLSTIAIAVVAMAPAVTPKDLTQWIADNVPGIPSWASWAGAVAIFIWRISSAANTIKQNEGN